MFCIGVESINKKMKKIIFVMSRMSIGGAQKSLVNAISQIDPTKYDVALYVRENKVELIKDISPTVRVVVNTNNNKKYYYYPSVLLWEFIRRFAVLIKNKELTEYAGEKGIGRIVRLKTQYEKKHYSILNEEYDILVSYLQGYTCKFAVDTIRAKKKVCFYHNSTDATPSIHQEYLPMYDEVITVTQNCQQFLAKRYPKIANHINVIENIINIDAIRTLAFKKKIETEKGKIVLCTCGRMSPEKGYELAVDAAEVLKRDNISFSWLFIGDGSSREKIEQRIKERSLCDAVHVMGAKSNPYPYINSCDIFVQPSMEEAQSLVIMEAQILHKSVVSTKTLGAQSLIIDGETGFLTDFTGEALAEKIETLIHKENLRKQMEENVRKVDYELYNAACREKWEKMLEEDV